MDWLSSSILVAALILLGLIIILLIFGAITGQFQEKGWETRRQAALRKRFSRLDHGRFDSETSSAQTPRSETEVTAEEKTALQMQAKETALEGKSDEESRPDYKKSHLSQP